MLVLQPVLHWGCCCANTGQGKTFPHTSSYTAAVPMGLSSEPLLQVAQNCVRCNSVLFRNWGWYWRKARSQPCPPPGPPLNAPFHLLTLSHPVQRSPSKPPWKLNGTSQCTCRACKKGGTNMLYDTSVTLLDRHKGLATFKLY